MATQPVLVSDSVDPLAGLTGLLLFPNTLKASLNGASLPVIPPDLESIHSFMKSREQRNPEKLKNDAKRIVDGGAENLESSLVGNVGTIAAEVKERPRERRPGLNLTRKRRPFTLRTNTSQPSSNLEPVFDIDKYDDPDEYFDACDMHENAVNEIRRLMGGGTEKLDILNLPERKRVRRPGILGKTYGIKHRYSVPNFDDGPAIISKEQEKHITSSAVYPENDDPSIITPENNDPQGKRTDLDPNSVADLDEVELAASAQKTEYNYSQGKGIDLDPNSVVDLDELELAASAQKAEYNYSEILEELLACNEEDLAGDGCLNLLQEKLNIKPLDMESLRIPDFHGFGRFSISSPGDDLRKSRTSSHVIDSALKHVNKSPMGNEQAAQNPINPVSSPTPPRSPFASLNILKKKILQSNPLNDRFSPFDVDISDSENVTTVQLPGKLQEQVDPVANLNMYSSELNPHVEVGNTEKTHHMDGQKGIESDSGIHDQFVDENASVHRENAEKKQSEVSYYSNEETLSTKNSPVKVIVGGNCLPDEYAAGNGRLVYEEDAHSSPNNIPDHSSEGTFNLESHDPNLSIVQDVAMDCPSTGAETQPKVSQADLQKVQKKVGTKRTRNARPSRKSIADYGTTFDNGVRRSKRIKMRPLEFWKGERFLYGVMDDSVKLIGVKYISPGKSAANLKVKPYIPVESSEDKKLLDLAARH